MKLSSSLSRRISHADHNDVDAVWVPDQLVVGHEVRLVAGKLKETQIAGAFTPQKHQTRTDYQLISTANTVHCRRKTFHLTARRNPQS